MLRLLKILVLTLVLGVCGSAHAEDLATNVFGNPLSLDDAFRIAMAQNSAILEAKADMRASEGVIVQTRSIVLPKVSVGGSYSGQESDSVERLPVPASFGIEQPNQNWNSEVRIRQSVYEGGRMRSAMRAVKLTREASLLNYETTVSDVMLSVRVAYFDVLLTAQQVEVQEASVKLLTEEFDDVTRRLNAGTVPPYNVLRAQVELDIAKPRLIRARNAHRVAKNNLCNLLGVNLPPSVWEDIPLRLSGKLEEKPYEMTLPMAIGKALESRSELAALEKALGLRREDIINLKAGFKPSAQIFGAYQWRSPTFGSDLTRDYSGWLAGAQLSWSLYDGGVTRGKVAEAQAKADHARLELEDQRRRIELEVRTTYSEFIQAREVLESQKKVQERAQEALRLAKVRAEAGNGTQLDVLGSQTALTEARTTQVQALRDYAVAVARLERAMGKKL
jgi:outer membrane protein TolC